MPYAKETRREKEKARAAKRRASGLCQNCATALPALARCAAKPAQAVTGNRKEETMSD